MKRHILIIIITTLSSLGGAEAQSTYKITNWLNNKNGAVSVTFDDGCYQQFATALPIINARKIKGTFYIITDMTYNCLPKDWSYNNKSYWKAIQTAANDGHEIGSHTVNHPDLSVLSAAKVDHELKNSRDLINSKIKNRKCLTMAYPEGKGSKSASVIDIARKYYIGARAAGINPSGYDPANYHTNPAFMDYFYQVECFVIDGTVTNQRYREVVNGAIKNSGWFIPMYHNLGTSELLSVSTAVFTSHMDEIAKNSDSLWIAPFADVLKYSKERISSRIIEKSSTEEGIVLSLTDSLPDDLFNHPLTINAGNINKSVVSVKQGKNTLSFNQKGSTVLFNAIPDAEDIRISFKE